METNELYNCCVSFGFDTMIDNFLFF